MLYIVIYYTCMLNIIHHTLYIIYIIYYILYNMWCVSISDCLSKFYAQAFNLQHICITNVINKARTKGLSNAFNMSCLLTVSLSRLPDAIRQLGPDGMAEWVERPSPVLWDRGIQTSRLRTGVESNQWFKRNACRFLARRSALLG